MDHPSGDEHDKVVELTATIAAVGYCRSINLAQLREQVRTQADELKHCASTPRSYAILFAASVIRKPSEDRINSKWEKLRAEHPELIGSKELDEVYTLLIDVLDGLLLKKIEPGVMGACMMRLNELQNNALVTT